MKKNMAVCFKVLLGLSLLSVVFLVALRVENLPQIISILYSQYGAGGNQFAVALNIPVAMCGAGVINQNWFPNPNHVKNAMYGPDRIFVSKNMIAARPKPIPGKSYNVHSEYLLLVKSNPPQTTPYDPLIKDLLAVDQNGCVVFYTYNSPCVNTCSTPGKPFSIIPNLDMISEHTGPKYFVFSQIWGLDKGSTQWRDNILEVNARVPLYRCFDNKCVPCVINGKVVDECWLK